MPLSAGTRLGPYEILASIGKGGMGEVYRARDTKLDRDVAIKVLPAALAQDPERLARFEREAKVLASLNHPNIAQIYGVEESSGVRALVMELVPGETLKGPVPLDEALRLAAQIADALGAAHEKGITHRDLKPANVMITPERVVKVLDFGLAAVAPSSGSESHAATNSPTLTMSPTRAGMILGTGAYMSPEQARGQSVDRRADIWAFGVLLYEMLTGQQLFRGDTVSDILASVLKEEPDLERVPTKVQPLLKRCLEKEPKKRLQAIGDWDLLLDRGAGPRSAAGNRWLWPAAASVLAVAAFAVSFVHFREPKDEPRVLKFSIGAPENASFVFNGSSKGYGRPVLSPVGNRLAFNALSPDGKVRIWIRALDSLTAQPLAGTEGAVHPFWSPDGRYLAFFAGGKMRKIDASGGPPVTLCDASSFWGGTWSRDGVIVFSPARGPLYAIPASGGVPRAVSSLDQTRQENDHLWPWFLPDGRHFLYLALAGARSSLRVGSIDSHESKIIWETRFNAAYAAGYLLFLRDATLMAQPFDARRLVATGEAFPLVDQIEPLPANQAGLFSVSENGLLVYRTGTAKIPRQFAWLDRHGKEITKLGAPDRINSVALSPDGKNVAATIVDPSTGNSRLWIYDAARGTKTRLTADAADEILAAWSPDGSRLIFNSNRNGPFDIFQKSFGTGGSEELVYSDGLNKFPTSWSPDGKFILYNANDPNNKADLWVLPMSPERDAGKGKPFPFAQNTFNETIGQFSPDGKWIAYQSDESKRFEIYVARFPDFGGKRQVSISGGVGARWRQDGREIFYLSMDQKLMAAEIKVKAGVAEVGEVTPLFDLDPRAGAFQFDVSGDGQHFLVRLVLEPPNTEPLTVVQNWFAGVKE